MVKNPVVFWELASHWAEKSVEFFERVFEWKFEYDENTTIFETPGDPNLKGIPGGIFTLKKAKLPFITIYIRVEDIHAKAKLVEEHGGHIVIPPNKIVPNLWICLFNEPSGVIFAMFQSEKE